MPRVTFEVESTAEPILIVSTRDAEGRPISQQVDLRPVDAGRRTGSITVANRQTHTLTWICTGNPGTQYKITLEPRNRVTLRRSRNPIESRIATTRLMTTGSDQFEVEP